MKIDKINKEVLKWHILIWVSYWTLEFILMYMFREQKNVPLEYYFTFFFDITFLMVFFYINMYFVINRHINSIPKTAFFCLVLVIIFSLFKVWIQYLIPTRHYKIMVLGSNRWDSFIILEFWKFSKMTMIAFAYWFYLKTRKEQIERFSIQKKQLDFDIQFLKAQINPHFLFNTLNFIYNDVNLVSRVSGGIILSLTKLLRNSLGGVKNNDTTIGKEIELLEEYLELQKIRFGDTLALKYTKKGNSPFFIFPPILLTTILENAFKYGVYNDKMFPIEVTINLSSESMSFICKNKIREVKEGVSTEVGLKNVRRRLDIVFKDKYKFETFQSKGFFITELQLKWSLI